MVAKTLTEEDLKGIEEQMEDHLREAAEAHMESLIAEVRSYLAKAPPFDRALWKLIQRFKTENPGIDYEATFADGTKVKIKVGRRVPRKR